MCGCVADPDKYTDCNRDGHAGSNVNVYSDEHGDAVSHPHSYVNADKYPDRDAYRNGYAYGLGVCYINGDSDQYSNGDALEHSNCNCFSDEYTDGNHYGDSYFYTDADLYADRFADTDRDIFQQCPDMHNVR